MGTSAVVYCDPLVRDAEQKAHLHAALRAANAKAMDAAAIDYISPVTTGGALMSGMAWAPPAMMTTGVQAVFMR